MLFVGDRLRALFELACLRRETLTLRRDLVLECVDRRRAPHELRARTRGLLLRARELTLSQVELGALFRDQVEPFAFRSELPLGRLERRGALRQLVAALTEVRLATVHRGARRHR